MRRSLQHSKPTFLDSAASGRRRQFSSSSSDRTGEVVDRMRRRFQDASSSSSSSELHQQQGVWESLWKDDITPWDLGKPTPALIEELRQGQSPIRTCSTESVRTLVPGCGSGHDLIALAQQFDDWIANKDESGNVLKEACVVGLDISDTSLDIAAQVFERECEFSPFDDRPTRVKLIKGDFFADPATWEIKYCYGGCDRAVVGEPTIPSPLLFDFIYDYTFFCSLPPSLRPDWGETTNRLLASNGKVLTLMFPVLPAAEKDDVDLRGPPFPVSPADYRRALEPNGLTMDGNGPYESASTDETRVGMELVCWWSRDDGRASRSKL